MYKDDSNTDKFLIQAYIQSNFLRATEAQIAQHCSCTNGTAIFTLSDSPCGHWAKDSSQSQYLLV